MRIVFMGTPAFAVPSLEALLRSGHQVVGVVTQPDKPRGHGQALSPSPVKQICMRVGVPVLQPTKMKDPDFLDALRAWQPDVIAVTAFGRILPPVILELPPRGCVNVHASLLPKYRGAAPIQWAVINGEQETGITTILMDPGMDTGPMLLQERVQIHPEETAGELAVRLAQVGARLLIKTVAELEAGRLTPTAQDHAGATLAPMLKKEDGWLDWTRPAHEIVNRVRGLTPWPGAYTYAGGERWMIRRAHVVEQAELAGPPGTVVQVLKDRLMVVAGQGLVAILELQPENSRRMSVREYQAGHRLSTGLVLTGPERVEGIKESGCQH